MDYLPAIVIFTYLALVFYIGIFAFRRGKATGEDFFLANRSIGPIIFFLSLFATNMTAFAILGSSGLAYKRGIGVYGLMASSSGLVIPLTLLVIGTRLWALGKRFGHMTQVQFFRDRWECGNIGTYLFLLSAAMLIPYLIISITGGGTILEQLTHGKISYPVGGAVVALVVMGNVFFGGMRGAVWVNVLQTILFLAFGTIAFVIITQRMPGGLAATVQDMTTAKDATGHLTKAWALQRTPPVPGQGGIGQLEFLSYLFIPLSSIMFPHMSIMCLTAKKVTAFKKTVVLYPVCIMLLWLPCVFLGAIANGQPEVNAAIAADSPAMRAWLAHRGGAGENGAPTAPAFTAMLKQAAGLSLPPSAKPAKTGPKFAPSAQAKQLWADVSAGKVAPEELGKRLVQKGKNGGPNEGVVGAIADPVFKAEFVKQVNILAKSASTDSVLLQMLKLYVPAFLAGILAAGIISAVMGSDCHQILALSTMFTRDVFDYYGGNKRFGEKGSVYVGRAFIVLANAVAYAVALRRLPIFDLAVTYAFSGFAAMAPVMVAALFWKRSTKWGALASALFVTGCILGTQYCEMHYGLPKGSPPKQVDILRIGQTAALFLSPGAGKLFVFGFMPVVPMVLGSAFCVVVASLSTKAPSQATLRRYFGPAATATANTPSAAGDNGVPAPGTPPVNGAPALA